MSTIRSTAGAAVAAIVATGVVAGAPVATGGPAGPASGTSAAASRGRTAQFDHPQENAYFPLRPGTVSHYRAREDGERFREVVTVTDRTKVILGVATTVVRDVMRRQDGTLAEKTHDWYAADDDGNVWYFGEQTATYDEHGHLESREGSWQAGVAGAVQGTIMPADPQPTDAHRQEYLRGHAEDQAWIVQRNATVRVPYGRLRQVVRTFEWSRLEPRVMSAKYYAPGLGIVREQDIAGGTETVELVSVRHR
ncbi:hypothetical protein [Nocardioides pocheonensis]|uniref:DUF3068 domain-containing protein n=1 Tax=Nocardioides pocheonensis TaxID=661485 RepID=A0A3N0GFB4_9ACTN|nr:hypothetical protein [Nocardioides pocheonensis]RNM11111.1 hypothetical protein EFL26_23485 [Nocardioides pocheonensis]